MINLMNRKYLNLHGVSSNDWPTAASSSSSLVIFFFALCKVTIEFEQLFGRELITVVGLALPFSFIFRCVYYSDIHQNLQYKCMNNVVFFLFRVTIVNDKKNDVFSVVELVCRFCRTSCYSNHLKMIWHKIMI